MVWIYLFFNYPSRALTDAQFVRFRKVCRNSSDVNKANSVKVKVKAKAKQYKAKAKAKARSPQGQGQGQGLTSLRNSGPIFRLLWTTVKQITGETVVCNELSFPIFDISFF